MLSFAARAAEPTEPLTVTRLPDAEKLLNSTGSDNLGVPGGDGDDFSRAIRQSLRAQQQSLDARCQSANRSTGPIAARWAWEASCRYKRY